MGALHERLRDLREGTGLSQAAFARRIGVTRGYVWLVERGEREPTRQVVERWAEAGGRSAQMVLDLIGDPAARTRDIATSLKPDDLDLWLRLGRLLPHLPYLVRAGLEEELRRHEERAEETAQPRRSTVA